MVVLWMRRAIKGFYSIVTRLAGGLQNFKWHLAPFELVFAVFIHAMKTFKPTLFIVVLAIIAAPFIASADDAQSKPIPYPLKKCIVSGDKFGGDMGDPYVYIYKDKQGVSHEIKFCCKSCLKDFNKDPDGYVKKIADTAAKEKK